MGGGGKTIFLFHISSSWVNCSWHAKFQLRGRSRYFSTLLFWIGGGGGGWLDKLKIKLNSVQLLGGVKIVHYVN